MAKEEYSESYSESYNNQSTGSRPCRIVETSNVGDDDDHDAKAYIPPIPDDFTHDPNR